MLFWCSTAATRYTVSANFFEHHLSFISLVYRAGEGCSCGCSYILITWSAPCCRLSRAGKSISDITISGFCSTVKQTLHITDKSVPAIFVRYTQLSVISESVIRNCPLYPSPLYAIIRYIRVRYMRGLLYYSWKINVFQLQYNIKEKETKIL